ncbi:MAG: hypothetical protein C9356_10265 [Oleiphilus sp.]|nr:MAG: hypothetical protein C9356_10265 [Oleiphilus sp.]
MKNKRLDQQFVVKRNENTLSIEGDITFDNVSDCFAHIVALPLNSVDCIDFSGVTYTDSSAISLLIEIYGIMEKQNRALSLTGVSPTFNNLIELYGVKSIIGSFKSPTENLQRDSAC